MLTSFTSLIAASAISFLPAVSASALVKKTEEILPSCTGFTPFTYAGCFSDPTNNPSALNLRATNLESGTMTVNTCVAFCKGNGYRYAGLEYYGICFCGSTVNGPQIGEDQCTYPCAGNTSEPCGGTNIISVYQDPTFEPYDDTDISGYQSLGCYTDGPGARTLPWKQDELDGDSMTVDYCLKACRDEGYAFAGLEWSKECWCGVVLGNNTQPLDAESCDFPCAGDPSQSCGGDRKLNLYVAKDLESREPCKDGQPPVSSSTYSSTTTTAPSSTLTTTVSTTASTTPTTTPSTTLTTTKATTTKITTTTVGLCTSTTTISPPAPTCEYKCGKWCSKPLPSFENKNDCKTAVSNCAVQLTSCFLNAGFPESLNCFKFASWCDNISSYCGSSCPGNKCSWSSCKSKYPPSNPPPSTPSVSTTVFPCPASTTKTTTTKATTTASYTSSGVPVPTKDCVCEQPHNPGKGYSKDKPVGGIELPCLTCNNIQSDFKSGNSFKLYNHADSSKCPSFPKPSIPSQCKKACDNQYTACLNVYAEDCKGRNKKRTYFNDNYNSAMNKCKDQWKDCYAVNAVKNGNGKCDKWNNGW